MVDYLNQMTKLTFVIPLNDIFKNGIWSSPQRILDYAKEESVTNYKKLINSMSEK